MVVGVNYQDVVEVLKGLPPAQVAEVYEFARLLKKQTYAAPRIVTPGDLAAFLATFGVWQEERSAEEIVADIYTSRDTGREDRSW